MLCMRALHLSQLELEQYIVRDLFRESSLSLMHNPLPDQLHKM